MYTRVRLSALSVFFSQTLIDWVQCTDNSDTDPVYYSALIGITEAEGSTTGNDQDAYLE